MESTGETHHNSNQEFRYNIQQVVESQLFDTLATRLFPEISPMDLKRQLLSFDNVRQFQSTIMYRCCQWVIENTMEQFTFSGTQFLSDKPALFISNHRDIALDAMMLQYILVNNGLDTSHIVIGANLFEMPMIGLMAKINKMYSIRRGGTPREYYHSLMQMSAHLRSLITQQGESVWIAQRNGRTKDGIDRTNPTLIKMIASSGNCTNPISALKEMNITPVSVSYEWEPCGWLKARELCLRQQGPYTKVPGEDTESTFRGIQDFKGRVHFSICQPLQPDELDATEANFDRIAALVDQRISNGYRIWPNSHIAKKMLNNEEYDSYLEAPAFTKYVSDAYQQYPLGESFRQILLGIYANAVKE